MAVTFLTSEDAQGIISEMSKVRMLINEVGRDVGHMMQMRHDLEEMVAVASTLNKTLTKDVVYYRSDKYKEDVIKDYLETKKLERKLKKKK